MNRPSCTVLGLILAGALSGCSAVPSLGDVPAAVVRVAPDISEPSPRTFTLVASGDVLVHNDVWGAAARAASPGRAFDFLPLLDATTELVRGADVALCHLEVPLSAPGGPYFNYPMFSVPPEVADALVAQGYDSCSTASNHTVDRGTAGVLTTLDALDARGLPHTGSARTEEEARTPLILDVEAGAGTVRLAHLSYTYGLNGLVRPADKPWLVSLIDDGRMLEDARAARAAGAEVVVVSMHWGTELMSEPTPQQNDLARSLLASPDVDLILGHHAHVVQPVEKIGDKWVVYGMGNLIASGNHDFADGATREGILPKFSFVEGADGRFRATAVEVTGTYTETVGGLRVVRIGDVLAGSTTAPGTTPASARLLKAIRRTNEVVRRRTDVPELTVR